MDFIHFNLASVWLLLILCIRAERTSALTDDPSGEGGETGNDKPHSIVGSDTSTSDTPTKKDNVSLELKANVSAMEAGEANKDEPQLLLGPYSSNNKLNVSLGLKNLKHNIRWYNPSIRDGSSLFSFAIKHVYNPGCDSPAKFKKNLAECLPFQELMLSDNTTKCKIIVLGEQWNETYRQLFRNQSLLVSKDAHFLTIKTCMDRLAITDFLVFPVSKESDFKFLPYELDHFQHMLDFELSASDYASSIRHIQLNVVNSCLPNLEHLVNKSTNDIVSNYNFTCGDTLMKRMLKSYQSTGGTSLEGVEINKLSFMNREKKDKSGPGAAEHCTLERDSIECSASRHLDSSQKHLYMIALYVQVYFLAEYLDGDPDDLQVCLRHSVHTDNVQKWFYGKLTASSTSGKNSFTLVECCRMTRKLKVYDTASQEEMLISWVCHDPYRVANIILMCINIVSYLVALLLPLCMRYFPPLSDPHVESGGDQNIEKEARPAATNGASPIPIIAINEESASEDEKKQSLLVPDDSRHLSMRRSSSVSSDHSCANALAAESRETLPEVPPHLAANIGILTNIYQQDAPSYIPEHDLLFLDRDPVYNFGLKTIFSLLLLFHVDCHALTVARRFLFLYCLWILVHFASVIVSFYYPSLAIHFQVFYFNFKDTKYNYGVGFNHLFYILVLLVPLCYALIHFLLLSPLLIRKQSVSHSLSWNENDDSISSIVRTDPKIIFYRRSKPCEISFYLLLLWRLKLLTNTKFWRYLFDNTIYKVPVCLVEDYTDAKTCINPKGATRKFLLTMFYISKAPLVLVVSLVHTLPFFVAHRELLFKPEKFIHRRSCMSNVSKWCIRLMTVASMCFSFFVTLSFTFLYGGMAIFCLVDVVRNIKTNVNHSVLFVSVLLYVQNALVMLEDDYREMKNVIFHVCKEVDNNKSQETERRPPLIWSSPDGEMAIPKRIFTGVCESLLPYSTSVLHTSLSLVLTISFVFFLYVLVIEFQALDQFTGIGQSLMTIFTVSIPGLMFKMKSMSAMDLDRERMYGKVKATIKDLLDREDVFVTTRRASELIARRDTLCEEKFNSKRRDTCPAWV